MVEASERAQASSEKPKPGEISNGLCDESREVIRVWLARYAAVYERVLTPTAIESYAIILHAANEADALDRAFQVSMAAEKKFMPRPGAVLEAYEAQLLKAQGTTKWSDWTTNCDRCGGTMWERVSVATGELVLFDAAPLEATVVRECANAAKHRIDRMAWERGKKKS